MNEKSRKKSRGLLTNPIISQLLSVLVYQTWFLINAKTFASVIIKYAIDHIKVFKNIDEAMRIFRKILEH